MIFKVACRKAKEYNINMDPNKINDAPQALEKPQPQVIESEKIEENYSPTTTETLNKPSEYVVKTFEDESRRNNERGMAVNGLASDVAAWYEKLRTAIENRDEEVILRAAIERIIRRRLLLGGNGNTVAAPLVRELVWARYFEDESIGDDTVGEVASAIDLWLDFRNLVLGKHIVKEGELNEWIYQLLSCAIEALLRDNDRKEAMISYIFHNVRRLIKIEDDTEETRDAQTFIAVRKSYAKEDLPFLRYALFVQYFGKLTRENLEETVENFSAGKKVIEEQLGYKGRFKIYEYVKRQIPPFLIFEDVLRSYSGKFKQLISNDSEFTKIIDETCSARYSEISKKVRRAIIRSIIFILLTKTFLAFTIEGTYDKIVYGHIVWPVLIINISIPVIMMIIVSFFIKAPGKDNTLRIINRIKSLLYDAEPQLGRQLTFTLAPKQKTLMDTIFTVIWSLTYLISFGILIYILTLLGFNAVSQFFFLFFFAIVCFLSYRINQAANIYTIKDKPRFITFFVDFFFMPIARVGSYLAEGVRSINVFIFLLDMLIEMPLKGLIAFFEQWFSFLHSKREDLA